MKYWEATQNTYKYVVPMLTHKGIIDKVKYVEAESMEEASKSTGVPIGYIELDGRIKIL